MNPILRVIDRIATTTTDNTKWVERAAANLNRMNEQEQSRERAEANNLRPVNNDGN